MDKGLILGAAITNPAAAAAAVAWAVSCEAKGPVLSTLHTDMISLSHKQSITHVNAFHIIILYCIYILSVLFSISAKLCVVPPGPSELCPAIGMSNTALYSLYSVYYLVMYKAVPKESPSIRIC